jgi:glycosyltransferase involved in cell wall biosynthesis
VRSATARRRLLRTVDCLLHVPGKWWLEGDGRELFMAMAAGVPIICPRSSLFAEYVAHDVDGLLYDERDEALEHIAALRRNPVLRAALARSARQKIAGLVAPEHVLQETRRIVLGEEPAGLQGGVVERERVAAK